MISKTLFIFFILLSFSFTGTQKSFEQSFEKLLKSDGNNAEELDIQIGKMIKSHPTNFLKALKLYEQKIQRIDALVGNFGEEFIDQAEASKKEASLRIAALEKAKKKSNDAAVTRLANKCIAELRKISETDNSRN